MRPCFGDVGFGWRDGIDCERIALHHVLTKSRKVVLGNGEIDINGILSLNIYESRASSACIVAGIN